MTSPINARTINARTRNASPINARTRKTLIKKLKLKPNETLLLPDRTMANYTGAFELTNETLTLKVYRINQNDQREARQLPESVGKVRINYRYNSSSLPRN